MNEEDFFKIVSAGIQAPSGDNLQPWEIHPSKDYNSFKLYGVEDKEDFFDVANSATHISGGAFLENIVISAQNLGYETNIEVNSNSSKQIAEVNFSRLVKERKNKLYEAIPKRATLRVHYKTEGLPKEFYSKIEYLCEKRNVDLRIVDKESPLSEVIYRADLIRLKIKKAHDYLASALRCTKREIERRDGLDYRTLGIPYFPKTTSKLLRSWNFMKLARLTRMDRFMSKVAITDNLNNSEGIGVIVSPKYSKEEMIKCGRFLENFWLRLTTYEGFLQPLAMIPFSLRRLKIFEGEGLSKEQKKELNRIEREVSNELNLSASEEVSMMFRFGVAKPPKVMTLRKPVGSFIKQE